jgi:hypothetical protein
MSKNRKSNKNKKKFTKDSITIVHEENSYIKFLNKKKFIFKKKEKEDL